MNIQAQCCGIILLLILTFFYRRQKKIQLGTGKAFWRALCVVLACVTLDVSSIVAITNRAHWPMFLVALICKSYLVSLIGVSFCSLGYVYVDIYDMDKGRYEKIMRRYMIVGALGAAAIYLLPIHYFESDAGKVVYTYGPSVITTYIFAVFFVMATFILTWKQKDRINPRRREAVLIWLLFWLVATLIQFFNNELLLVGYGTTLGIMVLYLELENPETNLDRRTGLFNQGALFQYMRQRYSENKKFSVLVMVLEHSMGRVVSTDKEDQIRLEGDLFLASIPEAVAFKNAGDETVLIFKNHKKSDKVMQSIFRHFEEKYEEHFSLLMSPSWIYIPDSSVVDSAEDILYLLRHTRENSREFSENNFFCIDEEAIRAMRREKEVEQLIMSAMEENRVEVYYQPIYSTKEGSFTCAEALVRIKDENGKMVPPGVFIDIAEQNGMILRLGEIVFEQVCRFIKENDIKQYGFHYIEVNLSVVQGAYEPLAETYIGIMKEYGIAPELINLEITESASIKAKKILLDNMKTLIDYGVRFSLDDFGTGQSNLNYIIEMPVDIVKFDKMMSNAYFENGKAKFVMDAAMHMIHGLELEIVSEGIETKEQYQTMEALGINYIQGYYFSKPLAAGDFVEFLRANAQ